jgi:multiple sugar transport system permease protein
MVRRRKGLFWEILKYAALSIILVWTLTPIFWMLSASFKTPTAIFSNPPEIIPLSPTLDSFRKIASGTVGVTPIARFFLNSLIVSAATVAIAATLSLLSAYALSRFRFGLKKAVMIGVLVTQMFPIVALLTPLYILYLKTGLINTYRGLVVAFTAFTLPFCVWMLKGFIDTIPADIDEAAIIDGCSRMCVLRRVLLPLISPGLLAAAVFAFLDAWNNLLFPMTLTTNVSMKTLPPGMIMAFGGEFKHDWSGMMAASILVSLPVTALFMALQGYLTGGLTSGSVKE